MLPRCGWVTPAEVVKVIDGDTLVVRISRDIHVRLLGCSAPETRTRDPEEKAKGLAAKQLAQQLVAAAGRRIVLEIPTGESTKSETRNPKSPGPDPSLPLTGIQTLERFLGRIYLPDGRDLGEALIGAGVARPA